MAELPTSAQPWMSGANAMPDVPNRTVNPEAPPNVEGGGPDVSGTAPDISGQTGSSQVTPAPPTQHPSFFRTLLFSLGKGLLEGTAAGLQAPLNPQGPAIAAANAPNIPVQAAQRSAATSAAMTSQQMDQLNVATTQLKLHQLQMVTHQMEEDQQNAVYNRGRDTLDKLMEKGKVDILATGDQKAIHDELVKRQADATAAGQGLLPLMVLPSGPDPKKPEFSLVMVGKERLTDDIDETWGAGDLGISQQDFDAAGLTKFDYHASKGMDQQKALQLKTTQYANWLTKASNQLGQWKRGQLQADLKTKGLAQQLQEFKSTQAFKEWKTRFDADTKKQVAAMSQNKAPAAVTQTAIFSQGALEQMSDAEKAMDAMEKQGVLGKTILSNKIEDYLFRNGAADPGWDNNTNRMMGKLRAALGNTATATMRAHTGRTSTEIYEDYKKRFGIGQSWAALRGAMEETHGLLQHYVDAASDKSIAAIRSGTGNSEKPKEGGRIRVQLSSGKTGTIDAEDFDGKTMKRLN